VCRGIDIIRTIAINSSSGVVDLELQLAMQCATPGAIHPCKLYSVNIEHYTRLVHAGIVDKALGLLSSECPSAWAGNPIGVLHPHSLKAGQELVEKGVLSKDRYQMWLQATIPAYVPMGIRELALVYWKEVTNYATIGAFYFQLPAFVPNAYVSHEVDYWEVQVVRQNASEVSDREQWAIKHMDEPFLRNNNPISHKIGPPLEGAPLNFDYGECSSWSPRDWPYNLNINLELVNRAKDSATACGNCGNISKIDLQYFRQMLLSMCVYISLRSKKAMMIKHPVDYILFLLSNTSPWGYTLRQRILKIISRIGYGTSIEFLVNLCDWAAATEHFQECWEIIDYYNILTLRRDVQLKVLKELDTAVFLSQRMPIALGYVPLLPSAVFSFRGLTHLCGREWDANISDEIDKRSISRRPMKCTNPATGEYGEPYAFYISATSLITDYKVMAESKAFLREVKYEEFVKDRNSYMPRGSESEIKLCMDRKSEPTLPDQPYSDSGYHLGTVPEWEENIGTGAAMVVVTGSLYHKFAIESSGKLPRLKGVQFVNKISKEQFKGYGATTLILGTSSGFNQDGNKYSHLKVEASAIGLTEISDISTSWRQYIEHMRVYLMHLHPERLKVNKRGAAEEVSSAAFVDHRAGLPHFRINWSQKNENGKLKGRLILAVGMMEFLVNAHASDIVQRVSEATVSTSVDASDPYAAFNVHWRLCTEILRNARGQFNCMDWSDFNIHHTLEFMALLYITRGVGFSSADFIDAETFEDWMVSNLWVAHAQYNNKMKFSSEGVSSLIYLLTGLCSGARDTYLTNQFGQCAYVRMARHEVKYYTNLVMGVPEIEKLKGDDYIAISTMLDTALMIAGCKAINGDLRYDGQILGDIQGEFLRIMHCPDGLFGQMNRGMGALYMKSFGRSDNLSIYEIATDVSSSLSTAYRRGRSMESCGEFLSYWEDTGLDLLDTTRPDIGTILLSKLPRYVVASAKSNNGWDIGVGHMTQLMLNKPLPHIGTLPTKTPEAAFISQGLATQDRLDKFLRHVERSVGVESAHKVAAKWKLDVLGDVMEHTRNPADIRGRLSEQAILLHQAYRNMSVRNHGSNLKESDNWRMVQPNGLFGYQRGTRRVVISPPGTGKTKFCSVRTYLEMGHKGYCNSDGLFDPANFRYKGMGLGGVLDGDRLIHYFVGWPEQDELGIDWWKEQGARQKGLNCYRSLLELLSKLSSDFIVHVTVGPGIMEDLIWDEVGSCCWPGIEFVVAMETRRHYEVVEAINGGDPLRRGHPNVSADNYMTGIEMVAIMRVVQLPTFCNLRSANYWMAQRAIIPVHDRSVTELQNGIGNIVNHLSMVVSGQIVRDEGKEHSLSMFMRLAASTEVGSWRDVRETLHKSTPTWSIYDSFKFVARVLLAEDNPAGSDHLMRTVDKFGEMICDDILCNKINNNRSLSSMLSPELGVIVSREIEALLVETWLKVRDKSQLFSKFCDEHSGWVGCSLYNILTANSAVMKWCMY